VGAEIPIGTEKRKQWTRRGGGEEVIKIKK